jgi:hypothetical protein
VEVTWQRESRVGPNHLSGHASLGGPSHMLSAAGQFLGDDVSRVQKGAWALALQALSQLSSDTCTTS